MSWSLALLPHLLDQMLDDSVPVLRIVVLVPSSFLCFFPLAIVRFNKLSSTIVNIILIPQIILYLESSFLCTLDRAESLVDRVTYKVPGLAVNIYGYFGLVSELLSFWKIFLNCQKSRDPTFFYRQALVQSPKVKTQRTRADTTRITWATTHNFLAWRSALVKKW